MSKGKYKAATKSTTTMDVSTPIAPVSIHPKNETDFLMVFFPPSPPSLISAYPNRMNANHLPSHLASTAPPPMASPEFDPGWKHWENIGELVPPAWYVPLSSPDL